MGLKLNEKIKNDTYQREEDSLFPTIFRMLKKKKIGESSVIIIYYYN